ncbi:P-loop containing nucleoside triphosphate hydrolase protein [Blastocladiella britannica]|nr:P-loop containing nucleoside triphosphate hydrolase protein [Blastocladiella britannica]
MAHLPQHLQGLSHVQRDAATSDAKVVFILAGPGSGKTRTLTSRVAHLVLGQRIKPSELAVVTFSTKAAAELRERLVSMLGRDAIGGMHLGTYHSVAARFLRVHAGRVELEKDFTIADRKISDAHLKELIAELPENEDGKDLRGILSDVGTFISKAKARNSSPEEELAEWRKDKDGRYKHQHLRKEQLVFINIFRNYNRRLRTANQLDFDDLLIYFLRLLRANGGIAHNIRSVLVDEIQDTSTIQLEITKELTVGHHSLTVVGDPDQSIYMWRSADTGNLAALAAAFPDHATIQLRENYRSTSAVLATADMVIEQDTSRGHRPSQSPMAHGASAGPPVVFHMASTNTSEAVWITSEIRRTIAKYPGLIAYSDIAVLVRTAALTRGLEAAFLQANVPYFMVGGVRFFQRAEVMDLVSYLQLLYDPSHTSSFARAVQMPNRGVGEASVAKINIAVNDYQLSCIEICRRLINRVAVPEVSRVRTAKLPEFLKLYEQLSKALTTPPEPRAPKTGIISHVLRTLVETVDMPALLRKQDAKTAVSRMENVTELIEYAAAFDTKATPETLANPDARKEWLGAFLQQIAAASGDDNGAATDVLEISKPPKPTGVTISTLHGSKGLEWPFVFVAGVDLIPHSFAVDAAQQDEERRLLYVGITRAQRILYLTGAYQRWNRRTEISRFLRCFFNEYSVDDKGRSRIRSVRGPPSVTYDVLPPLDKTVLDFFRELRVSDPFEITEEQIKSIRESIPLDTVPTLPTGAEQYTLAESVLPRARSGGVPVKSEPGQPPTVNVTATLSKHGGFKSAASLPIVPETKPPPPSPAAPTRAKAGRGRPTAKSAAAAAASTAWGGSIFSRAAKVSSASSSTASSSRTASTLSSRTASTASSRTGSSSGSPVTPILLPVAVPPPLIPMRLVPPPPLPLPSFATSASSSTNAARRPATAIVAAVPLGTSQQQQPIRGSLRDFFKASAPAMSLVPRQVADGSSLPPLPPLSSMSSLPSSSMSSLPSSSMSSLPSSSSSPPPAKRARLATDAREIKHEVRRSGRRKYATTDRWNSKLACHGNR